MHTEIHLVTNSWEHRLAWTIRSTFNLSSKAFQYNFAASTESFQLSETCSGRLPDPQTEASHPTALGHRRVLGSLLGNKTTTLQQPLLEPEKPSSNSSLWNSCFSPWALQLFGSKARFQRHICKIKCHQHSVCAHERRVQLTPGLLSCLSPRLLAWCSCCCPLWSHFKRNLSAAPRVGLTKLWAGEVIQAQKHWNLFLALKKTPHAFW